MPGTEGTADRLVQETGRAFDFEKIRHNLWNGYRYRSIQNPSVYLNRQARDLAGNNVRGLYTALAQHELSRGDSSASYETLKRSEQLIPFPRVPSESYEKAFALLYAQTAYAYQQDGDIRGAHAPFERSRALISYEALSRTDQDSERQALGVFHYHLAMGFERAEELPYAIEALETVAKLYPQDKRIAQELKRLKASATEDTEG